ncbi:FtsK/SpoIIIE domain-containing protein [Nocardia carnea]|uniref:FtsK/SpoIIIE domain-containing protein n=1 Tax=Nocardia carnea TaxID=37328 RepID=UPI002457A387|nr:FtsK/SpoIIIE domain-containing protein [Nocardia carnea]
MAGNNAFNIAFLVSLTRNKIGGIFVGGAIGAIVVFLGVAWMYFSFGLSGVLGMAGLGFLGASGVFLHKDQKRQRERRAVEHAAAELAAQRAPFLPEVHYALDRLQGGWHTASLWASVGLGVLPATNVDPGMYPRFIDAEPTAIGARVRLAILDGHAAHRFASKRDELANGLRVAAVRVIEARDQVVTLDLQVRQPLEEINVSPLLDAHTAEQVKAIARADMSDRDKSEALKALARTARITVRPDSLVADMPAPLMMSEFGNAVVVNLATGAHGAVQGASRSGKSIFLNNLLAFASLMRDVRVVIIDPNTATCAPWWRTAYLVTDSDDPREATAILAQVNKELKERSAEFWASRTDRISAFSPEMPLYLVVIDEVPEYAKDKDFQAELKKFGAQSAKFGGRGYPSGQKLGEDSLSTATRANLFDRWCFRVESRNDMGHLFENFPALEAQGLTAVDGKMSQGTALVRTRSHPEVCRARAYYLPTELCWAISDAIVAVRGEVRPLPGTKTTAPELPPSQADSNQPATDTSERPAAKKPVPGFRLPPTGGAPILPNIPQVGRQDGTVIPFDRSRSDRPETTPPTGTTPPDDDTGTE